MKKILIATMALLLIIGMAVPAHAATPGYKIPEVPQVSQIKLKIDFGPDFWARWFEAHPIEVHKTGYMDTWTLNSSGQFWD